MRHIAYDLKGQQFGYLTVLERTDNVNGRVAWICKCECGQFAIAKSCDLLRGKQTNCGCRRKKRGVEQLHYVDGTCIEMLQSKTVRSNSRSGVTGVFYDSKSNKWRAEIMLCGKRYYLGRYTTFQDAVLARKKAEKEYYDEFLQKYFLLDE